MKIQIPRINLTLQLVFVFVLTLCVGRYLPESYTAFFYSISLSLKELLLFCLPFIIFPCLFYSMVINQGRAFRFLLLVFLAVCASNFLAILSAYGFGMIGLSNFGMQAKTLLSVTPVLQPLWQFQLPVILSNEWALGLGLGFGLYCSFFSWEWPLVWGKKTTHAVTLFLKKVFIPTLPLFAFGFILKMEYEGILGRVIGTYAPIMILVTVANLVYILSLFGIASKFKWSTLLKYLKNVLPAGMLAFTTMSSLATMPLTLNAAEKNTNDPELARAIIPATVNIHMIGDSISIPIVAMGILLSFDLPLPTFMQYLVFTQFFMLAKFAVPGVPCGSILVMLPIFEKCFGFTPEMSAFVAASYLLFEPVVTATNVLGNSVLAIVLSKVMRKIMPRAPLEEPESVGA